MADEDGLPPPPPRPAAQPAREPDLDPDMLRDSVANTLEQSAQSLGSWGGFVENAKGAPAGRGIVPFRDGGANPLQPVESILSQAAGSDPSLEGTLNAIAAGQKMGGRVAAVFTDEVMVGKIKALQEQFLKKHDRDLRGLAKQLSDAKQAMKELGQALWQTRFDPRTIEEIMLKKRRLGDDTHRQIAAALEGTSDPDKRRQLEKLRDDLDGWIAERDARVQREQPEVDAITNRLTNMEKEVRRQERAMLDAAAQEGPTLLTGPSGVIETTHTRPDALLHVASLHNFLLGSRAQLDRTYKGE